MNKDVIKTLIMIFLMAIMIVVYLVYVLQDEHKKMKYYDKNLYYDTDWDKYSTMIVKQKKILLYKKTRIILL